MNVLLESITQLLPSYTYTVSVEYLAIWKLAT